MKMNILILVGAACVLMAGAAPVKVACIGDSITSGWALKDPARDAYPAQLQRILGDGYEVRNFGKPGLGVYLHTTWNGGPRAWSRSEAYAEAKAWRPDIIVSNLGANDWEEYLKESTPGDDGKEQIARGTFRSLYADVLEGFKADGAAPRMIVWTRMGPLGPKHSFFKSPVPILIETDLSAVAEQVGAEGFDARTPLLPFVKEHIPDGIHPDPVAAKALAEAVAAQIRTPAAPQVPKTPKGVDTWAWIDAHPAVVNPVVPVADPGDVLSLRGEWDFVTHGDFRSQLRNCQSTDWSRFNEKDWTNTRKIQVPGCWEAQGVGGPGPSVPWNSWDNSPKGVNHKYMGSGWYKKTVTIPAAWSGKRVWLKIGGIRSQGWVWVNDEQVAHVNNWCGTYKYEITPFVKPGEPAKVVVQADNTLPTRKGYDYGMHHWGGIYRDMELEATPQTFIDDAWFRGNFDRQEAELHVEVAPASHAERNLKIRVTVEDQVVEQTIPQFHNSTISQSHNRTIEQSNNLNNQTIEQSNNLNNRTIVKIPLRNFRPWSPEHPNLYTGVVELVENGKVVQRRHERFGVRKIEVRGKEFYLNNQPFFVRGFGDDYSHPVTGTSPADRDYHRRHLAAARAAGFNYVRQHTHCENPEYFEAADEMGILIQPEMPYYCDMPGLTFEFDPVREVTELWRNYRRHPSFGTYSMGNEGTYGRRADIAMHHYVKAMDPDRLKINQDSQFPWINPAESSDVASGPINVWPRGTWKPDRPFWTHEYLNLCVKLDSRLEPRFNGGWAPPVRRAERLAWLNRFGLDQAWGDRLQDAQHALQRVYQKRGVEWGRSDPECDGLIFWTIADVVVRQHETYTAQGLFNPFWEQKSGGYSAQEFAQFNSARCVLADFDPSSRILTAGETLKADVLFANYGDAPLTDAQVKWTLSAEGKTLAEGTLPAVDAPLGPARKVAALTCTIPSPAKPVAAKVSVTVGGVSNAWDLWLFPKCAKADGRMIACAPALRDVLARHYENLLPMARAAEARVVVAPWRSVEAQEALARGQRVVAIGRAGGGPNVSLGWWNMGEQVGMALLKHPALGDLPHDGALSPLLFRIVKHGRQLPWKGLAAEDLVVVGEGGQSCFLYLAGANCGKGRVLASFGLDLCAETPEGGAILRGMIDYAGSEAFAPKGQVELEKALEGSNGVDEVLTWSDTASTTGGAVVPDEATQMYYLRGRTGKNVLEWTTKPVPQDVRAKDAFAFTFRGGMGYPSEPKVAFTVTVNGEKVVEIPETVWKSRTWTGPGGTLKYERDASAENGVFTLTVPSAKLEPGRPARVRVTATCADSQRWFGIAR